MAIGGIPFYLNALESDKSATQNIENLCFRKDGLLNNEFKNLFASLFKNSETHENIIRCLSSKQKGWTRKEILKKTGLISNGAFTKKLEELEENGFISRYQAFGQQSKGTLFRLSDFHSAFYLKFIEKNNNYDEGVWLNAIDLPAYRAWSGFAFEQLCLAHIPQVKKALGINGILTQSAAWQGKSANGEKAQIGLLIDRRDQVINLCEMKFSLTPYTIDKAYMERLQKKIAVFKSASKTQKAIFLTMITTYGLAANAYSGMVQNSLDMEVLFEK